MSYKVVKRKFGPFETFYVEWDDEDGEYYPESVSIEVSGLNSGKIAEDVCELLNKGEYND